jgi:flagellar basal body-associated protein FliL
MMTFVLIGVISLIAGGAGFALPQVINSGSPAKVALESQKAKRESSGRQPGLVSFGEVVVNLADERLTRYLHVNITFLVDEHNDEPVNAALEKKKTVLKSWLISYLSDKSVDDVRGAAGVNRARREIRDQFNGLLFPDGSEKIRDVLFEEFTVR